MRVLVVGGTGFIGSHVARRLAAAGHRVTVYHRGETVADLPPEVDTRRGDRADPASLGAAVAETAPDVVLHVVAMTAADAEAAVTACAGRVGRLVAVSSMDVYRARNRLYGTEPGPPDPVPLAEDAPLREQLYPYRAAAPGPGHVAYDYDKIPVERAVLGHPELVGTVLRLPMVYGPGDAYHRLAEWLGRVDAGRPAIPLGAGRAGWRWSRGYVENVAHAIALATTDGRAAGEVYNVGDEPALSEADWGRAVGRAAGWAGEVVAVPDASLPEPFGRPLDWRQHLVGDTRKLREQMGYAEPVPPDEALRRTVAWERAHPPAASPPVDFGAEDAGLKARRRDTPATSHPRVDNETRSPTSHRETARAHGAVRTVAFRLELRDTLPRRLAPALGGQVAVERRAGDPQRVAHGLHRRVAVGKHGPGHRELRVAHSARAPA